jgi:hypothetical protein
MVRRVVTVRWPKCDTERRKQGYPKMVEIKPGKFDWERPCTPCAMLDRKKEEKKAKKKAKEDEKNKAFWQAEKKRWQILSPKQVELQDPQLRQLPYGIQHEVSGSIKNKATVEVSAIELNIVAYDCVTNATSLAQCDKIESAHKAIFFFTTVAPGQVTRFREVLDLSHLSTRRGVLSWKVEVEKVRTSLDASDDEFLALMGIGSTPGGSLEECCL